MMEQNLLKTTARGYEVAVRRGDVCLVRNYLEELQRWSKQQYRYEAVRQGELLATGEDADLELHHQPLPLQKKWLLQRNFLVTSLADTNWINESLTIMKELRDELVVHLSTHSPWQKSLEELYIGSAFHLLENGPILKNIVQKRSRLHGKRTASDFNFQSLQHLLLRVLSFASLLNLTEDLHYVENQREKRLQCVSNLGCAAIRSMGRLVDEERQFSALPLVSHVCAMCGHLLHPATEHTHLAKDMGRPGPACQVQGTPLADQWNAMPLFLLLWSKRTLAASLKSVFVYDESTNTLRLKKGISSAPWLHFTTVAASSSTESLPTRGAGRHSLCMKNPWWYCNTCFHYWLSSSRAGEYFHNFEMNTNASVSWSTQAKQLVSLS